MISYLAENTAYIYWQLSFKGLTLEYNLFANSAKPQSGFGVLKNNIKNDVAQELITLLNN
jgi:hypothetical protein